MGIRRLNSRIATLERRAEYLESRVKEARASEAALSFDRAELAAIEAAIAALRLYGAMLDAEVNPVLILDEIVQAFDAGDGERMAEAVARARLALVTLEPLVDQERVA
jgi:hypothetical protein